MRKKKKMTVQKQKKFYKTPSFKFNTPYGMQTVKAQTSLIMSL